MIFKKVWKEKTPPDCATISSTFEVPSCSSQPVVAQYSGLTPKALTYPPSPTTPMVLTPVPQANLNLPPLIQMALLGFFLNKYVTVDLPQPLSAMPQDYLKHIPRFNGEDDNTTQSHIETFSAFAKNINVEHLDVAMKLFVQSLDGEARKWFKSLPDASITTWEKFENSFTQKWGEKRNH